ncbi:Retrovirus-related Pol polyprotein from transposon 17.6, partial [Stegodyphus mimosarum]
MKIAKLHIKPSKSQFAHTTVKYLGHVVRQGQRRPAKIKIQAIKNFPKPTTKTQVWSSLGLAGYYRRYISQFSVISAPLTDLLKGKCCKSTINWTDDCQNAFDELKKRLTQNPVLYSPNFSQPFIVQCDASNIGIGVVLSRLNTKDEEYPIIFLSKKFSPTEQKYSTIERECAAIVFAVQKLKFYLDGPHKFIIQTDHNPLVWLDENTGTNPRLFKMGFDLTTF